MIESGFPIVEVPDMDAAMRFYHDALGTAVVYRYPVEGDPVFVTLQAGASQLGLGLAENATAGEGAGMLLWFYLDDVDQATAALEAAGYLVIEPPDDSPWGERVAMVSDPFGTRVRLATRIDPQPEEE
ncbi:VOC family protein [Agromyces aurantiacus]|uniref:VOC family protein n=1 Tax=Agromyces aurantiacus TaxID=165814 RepID=A0ABV9R4G2_9MICO|nr:VOC family protein [Agromyces aurantiacus]MBM7503087.1 putative glyoxalase superfamily protein PhnB [Agromyces aurantiacus]